jgi:excisionase family DNA binding protein
VTSNELRGSENQPGLDKLITLKEAAALGELSYSHLRRLARTGEIWAKKFGTTWLTTKQAVDEYLARDHRPGPKPKGSSGTE